MSNEEPVFFNPQTVEVLVYDEKKRRVSVQPQHLKGRDPKAIFEVKGEWYRQFLVPYGPLALFRSAPQGANPPEAPAQAIPRTPTPRVNTRLAEHQQQHAEVSAAAAPHDVSSAPPVPEPVDVDIDPAALHAVAITTPDASPEEQEALARFVTQAREGLNPEFPSELNQYAEVIAGLIEPETASATTASASAPPRPMPKKPKK